MTEHPDGELDPAQVNYVDRDAEAETDSGMRWREAQRTTEIEHPTGAIERVNEIARELQLSPEQIQLMLEITREEQQAVLQLQRDEQAAYSEHVRRWDEIEAKRVENEAIAESELRGDARESRRWTAGITVLALGVFGFTVAVTESTAGIAFAMVAVALVVYGPIALAQVVNAGAKIDLQKLTEIMKSNADGPGDDEEDQHHLRGPGSSISHTGGA